MINFNGECYSRYNDIPEEQLTRLNALPVYTHHFLAFQGKIALLEPHYFAIMANLRRFRLEIPMDFTLTYFQEQLDQLNSDQDNGFDIQKVTLKFYRSSESIKAKAVVPLLFIMETQKGQWQSKDFNLILYKDHSILTSEYSNLFQTNESLRELGRVFAYENGFDAALIMNDQKRLAEGTHGAVFLFDKDQLQTPKLAEGVVNTVLRNTLIDFIKNETELEVIESEVPVFSIQKAEELFLISSEYGWLQVGQFRKKNFEAHRTEIIQQNFINFLKNQL